MNTVTSWFALQTEPRSEKKVERSLLQKGYECLSPIYRQKRQWSDRTVMVELPLFPRYVLCRFNPSAIGRAVSTPGVSRIVGFGGRPAEVSPGEIEALQLLSRSDVLREPWTYIPQGTLVKVETGPLTGVEGIICSNGGKPQLVLSVTLLQRSVAVQVDPETVLSVIEGPDKREAGSCHESNLAMKLVQWLPSRS